MREAAVFGIADARRGERVVAALVVGDPSSPLAVVVEALVDHCAVCLADYKRPRQWIIVDALPRNATGKLEKARLRESDERDYSGDADARRTHTQ